MHDHSTASDGWERPKKVILWLRSMGYKGAVFTDHNDLLIEQGDFYSYQKIIESFGDDSFIVIGGMEISVVKPDPKTGKPLPTLCHIGNIGITAPKPYVYNPKWDWDRLWDVLQTLRDQGSISILNHVKDCKPWAPWASDFDGFELFNDFSTKAQYHENYVYQRDAYLNILKTRQRLFVVAGIDLHLVHQALIGRITTFVFPESFSKEGILDAIRQGKAIAASNIEDLLINIAPSINTNFLPDGGFKIEGAIRTVKGHIPPKEVIIYKDGSRYKTVPLKSKGPVYSLSQVFFFSFEDVAEGSASCYTLEIEEFMVTSLFCFQKESEARPLPNKAFRITNVRTDQMFYRTEKEGLEHPYPLGSAFEYCYKDFALTKDGFVFGCKNPLMVKGVSDEKDGAVLYYAPEIYKANSREETIEKVGKSFAITLGKNEYKCVENKNFYCNIIANSKVGLGDKFYVCDPDGPILYNKKDGSISCDKTCEGEASSPGISVFWSFRKISGDCPMNNPGSIWLVPKDD